VGITTERLALEIQRTYGTHPPLDLSGILPGRRVVAMALGANSSLAVDSEGHVFAWGDNSGGQLGDGTKVQRNSPVPVETSGALAGKKVIAVAAGHGYSVALASDGDLLAWGSNSTGELGDGTFEDRSQPVAMDRGALGDKRVTAIATGFARTLVLTADGGVYACGMNYDGGLGDGTTEPRNVLTPVNLENVPAGETVVAIEAGYLHSLMLTSGGHVLAWGINRDGILGDGTLLDQRVPVLLGGDLVGKKIRAIAAGGNHNLALSDGGELFTWTGVAFRGPTVPARFFAGRVDRQREDCFSGYGVFPTAWQ